MSRQIIFINSIFPCLSETFIFDQFTTLRKGGLSFRIVSNHRPDPTEVHPRMESIQSEVDYLCEASLKEVLKAHIFCLMRHPWRYLRALWGIARAEEKLKTSLAQFSGAALILDKYGQNGNLHIHTHFTYGGTAVALWLKRLSGTPYTVTLHGSDLIYDNPPDLREKLENAEGIVSISQFNVDFLAKHFPQVDANRKEIIRMGVPPLTTPPSRPAPSRTLRILNVGRLSVHKAQHDLIDACALLRNRGVDFVCSIVGEGDLRSALEQQIADLKLGAMVELTGAKFHQDVLALYGQYDVFVLCSITEGQPVVLMEAMRARIPVIATQISAIPELVQNAGILVPPSSPVAIADAIEQTHSSGRFDPDRGEQIVRKEYEIETNTKNFQRYLERFARV